MKNNMLETTLKQVLESPEIQEALHHIKVMNTEMGETRDEIKEFNKSMTEIKIEMAKMAERTEWICKFFWILAGSVITSLVATAFQVFRTFI
jgi:uncharacterized coiled-coil DUF342 family protein